MPSVSCASLHAELFLDRRNRYGIYGPFLESGGAASGIWWRYRLPGFGVVDWHKYADILAEIGYKGPMNIEHEGLLVAKRYLEQTLI